MLASCVCISFVVCVCITVSVYMEDRLDADQLKFLQNDCPKYQERKQNGEDF